MLSDTVLLQLFVIMAFVIQLMLVAHFALRRWAFSIAMRFGVIVYGLGIPAAIVSIVLWFSGQPWYLWIAGLFYLAWAAFGYSVEYLLRINWRTPIHWPIFIPYVLLYFASMMFYWWPLATISRILWFVYAALFVISTLLNLLSHGGPGASSNDMIHGESERTSLRQPTRWIPTPAFAPLRRPVVERPDR
jgi:hypothetical protein